MNSFNNSFNNAWQYDAWLNFTKKQKEKADLKKVGFYTGVAILLNILVQNVLTVLLAAFDLTDKYLNDGVFAAGFDILFTVLALLVPFALVGRKMNAYSGAERVFYLGAPYRYRDLPSAVLAGVGCCMGANIITNYISAIFNNFGYEPSDLEFNLPDGIGGFLLSLVRMAVVAGIVEEIAMRGYVLGNLRFYGDGFAIAMSSVVFAVIHGNFSQMPFALVSAFGLGYFSVKTGTMWTGVIIHMLNNAISVIFFYVPELVGEEDLLWLQALVIYGLIAVGIFCAVRFSSKTRDIPLNEGRSLLTTGEKLKAYFCSVPMILSLVYFVVISIIGITEIS